MGDNTVNAIDGVSLSLEKGDLIVILGPSGAGKSTLLNLIGGLDSPTDGSIGTSCSYGRDRCGYYASVFGALAGATYREIQDDYMVSMCNYYHIEEFSDEHYAVASMTIDRLFYIMAHPEVLDDLLHVDWNSILDYDMDCEREVSDFLVDEVGFSAARLQTLKDSITA